METSESCSIKGKASTLNLDPNKLTSVSQVIIAASSMPTSDGFNMVLPIENLLIDVYQKFLRQKSTTKEMPIWAQELKEIIQDQIDTNLSLSLQEVSQSLRVHPAYLSREFSKYFDNLSFGEYIRKLRIEKAIKFLETTKYSLSEIAYLTGFSDQSHFARVFKKQTGLQPTVYKKLKIKGKS